MTALGKLLRTTAFKLNVGVEFPGVPVAPAAASQLATTGVRFGPDVLKQAEAALAQHIGGIAKIVVKRAAQKARDERELYLLLGDEIEDKEERKAFVRKVLSPPAKP